MSETDIPKAVRDFVFEYIDSVEQLEILLLLLLESDSGKTWTASDLSNQLRSNLNSIEKRLALLSSQNLVQKNDEVRYSISTHNKETLTTIHLLADYYRGHRYRILEMIFSPMKRSRDLAEAFRLSPTKPNKGDSNG